MLQRLFISNVVLIDRIELDFRDGLSVLTGETGAGKSILLDALALALGAKSDAGLVRAGAESATVVAEFSDGAMLKRVLYKDGKSKCWANDEPVTIKTLKELGDGLVEIHGQFADHGLLDEKTHVHSLDSFGGYGAILDDVKKSYMEFKAAESKLTELRVLIERSAKEREFLEHNVKELEMLKPKPGEEDALAETRRQMMDMEKNAGILKDAAATLDGIGEKAFAAAHILERTKSYKAEIDRLYEIGAALSETLDAISPKESIDVADLEAAEERLFALRACARKLRVAVDELPAKLAEMRAELDAMDNSDAELNKAERCAHAARAEYDKFAAVLTQERIAAADKLCALIKKELPDLKLGTAEFAVDMGKNDAPTMLGCDRVLFMLKTNPGMPFAPLAQIASGGELARLMLALRVVLAGDAAKVLIFDEIDTGISGATAAAVGKRMAELAKRQQIIAITHSAQVAGFADAHFLITKDTDGKTTTAAVAEISGRARENEIARIISGAKITGDAIAAAKTLMKNDGGAA